MILLKDLRLVDECGGYCENGLWSSSAFYPFDSDVDSTLLLPSK
jgi:hypothetical protein